MDHVKAISKLITEDIRSNNGLVEAYIPITTVITKTVEDPIIDVVHCYIRDLCIEKEDAGSTWGGTRFDSHGYVASDDEATLPNIELLKREFPTVEFIKYPADIETPDIVDAGEKLSDVDEFGENNPMIMFRTKGSTGWYPLHE